MTDLEKAARQALEALELSNVNYWWGSSSVEKAITDLRKALEKPYPESFIDALKYDVARRDSERAELTDWQERGLVAEAALARLLDAQQEPVAWQVMVEDEAMKEFSTKDIAHDWCVQQKLSGSSYTYWIRPLYTRPLAREWVGLTDDEIHDIYDEVARREPYNMAVTRRNIARAIEAKLMEKNA